MSTLLKVAYQFLVETRGDSN